MPLQRATGALLRRPSLLIIGASALSLVLAALTALSLWEMRSDALARARDAADNLALILQRDIARNIEVYDLSLQAVIDGVRDPAMLALPPAVRQLVLFDRSTNAQDLGSLLVTDKAGDVVIDSHSVPPRHIYLGDRDYFQVHQASDDVGLYISEPFMPRATGLERSLGLSRRLNGPHGEFNGIVVGTLRLNYFRRLFDGINLGPHATVTLIRTDGTLLMRRPYNEKLIGRNLADATAFQKRLLAPEGSYVDIAGIDGIERLFSFRHIGDHPLIVTVGLATEDIYAEWWRRAWVISGIVLMLDAVFIVLSFLFAQQLRKRLEMEQQLHLLANTDSLTGLGTRRALDSALDVEWRRANRHHTPMAVLMIDVDDFKPYNDRYGHAAGDTALRTVARCINDSIKRPGDFAGRYGGEEFCAVLPNTDLGGAARVAESIRAAVLAANERNAGSAYGKLTVSIGVAVHSGIAAEDDTLEDLVRLADGRLYEAKAAGRNVVMPRHERPKLPVV
ncbi:MULTISPECIES: sensor domain-containing diguanylate cyclase [Ralstonia]|jgi:diguanylate cyclase (GGDEF)-like protein|uniref:diguanylate cyclase n=1 Tax=Ralstonia pickettii OR214 TaxID=1264675 RepID=R0CSP0_RALPI|nr:MULTISPECIES: sensor domain-containing diguanylate cyclase [Ralstonia]MEA3271246.1 sensor domain-containing diguanylate cyclase [Pseudomonadota bacterium]ENZ79415.1 diguanylate cyclase (GGDEF) domain-containing protein [Ralstonia pickettii OR214]MBL4779278.1 GGDEF domain-containing protein [Ralstonia sp.]MCM3580319.1 sensor domain-containing diguanylate cyclase [Ralstonia pickettii]MDR9385361.1 sensor domain-containing diguanylate cyclase [Ralstonia sp. 11b]